MLLLPDVIDIIVYARRGTILRAGRNNCNATHDIYFNRARAFNV